MKYQKARTDAFVDAVEKRLAPLQQPQGKTAQQRRSIAEAFDVVMTTELGIAPIDVATEEHTIPVAGHPDARLRVYWPTTERPDPATVAGLPILVYFFGGGFEIAGIDWVWWDASFRERARDAGIILVAGEYSHAPEVTYPAQPEQCWSVFEWAATNARQLGGDPDRLAIGGGSSGGNLAAATALMNRDRARRPVRLQLLEVPLLDLTAEHLDLDAQASLVPKPLFRRLARMIVGQYLGPGRAKRREPYASPLLAESFEGMPPTVIYTAELDALRGDGEAYARALSDAGVPVTCLRMIGQNHGSGGFRGYVPAADHLHRDIVTTLRTLHDDPVTYPEVGGAMTTLADLALDAGIHRWITRIGQLSPGIADLTSTDPAVQRVAAQELSDLLAVDFTLPIPDGVEIDDFEIAGPGGALRMRRYRAGAGPDPAPSQLWLHGGGFYAGTIDEVLNDRLCARRAADSGVQVFSLEYRLAPEHPYPAPVLDAVAALEALAADPVRFGVDLDHLGIGGGNSAGAAIAASTALRLRETGGLRLTHVDLEVPPTAMRPVGRSATDYAIGFGLDQMEWIVAMYTGPGAPADPLISPLDVLDLGGLPPTLIMVGEHDPLRDSGMQYAERLREAGVPVELFVGAGHLHGTPGITAAFDGASEWQEQHARQLALAYRTDPAALAG